MSVTAYRRRNLSKLKESFDCAQALHIEHIVFCSSSRNIRGYKSQATRTLFRISVLDYQRILSELGSVAFVTLPSSALATKESEESSKDGYLSFLEAVSSEEIVEASHGDMCKKCGSRKLHNDQKQTRSGDESMTLFVTCMNCGKRWKM